MHRLNLPMRVLTLLSLVLAMASAPEADLSAQQPAAPSGYYDAAPYLGEIRNEVLYDVIWERPQLSKRDRSLVTVAVTQALYAADQLRTYVGRALDNGVTPAEISELIAHVLWYAGFPTAVNATRVAGEVFQERGLPVPPTGASEREPVLDAEPRYGPNVFPATPYVRGLLDLLYTETWERPELSLRDRSLITVATNTALYRTGEIRAHVGIGLNNGLTQEEISEIITHVTFYAGFPAGVNGAVVAAEVFEQRGLELPDARWPGAPLLDDLIEGLVYEETWPRTELSPRDRSIATIAMTGGSYQTDQLRAHIRRGLDNGITPAELSELVAQLALYSGFPSGVNTSLTLAEVFSERGIPLP